MSRKRPLQTNRKSFIPNFLYASIRSPKHKSFGEGCHGILGEKPMRHGVELVLKQ
jgi:hypothetical protein